MMVAAHEKQAWANLELELARADEAGFERLLSLYAPDTEKKLR